MIQAGPVANVHMPKDKITGVHQGFGFVEFRSEDDAEYAIKVGAVRLSTYIACALLTWTAVRWMWERKASSSCFLHVYHLPLMALQCCVYSMAIGCPVSIPTLAVTDFFS